MVDVGIFYGHLIYFKAIRYIFEPFVLFYGNMVYGKLYQKKIGNLGAT
jgi:hypothetical protein